MGITPAPRPWWARPICLWSPFLLGITPADAQQEACNKGSGPERWRSPPCADAGPGRQEERTNEGRASPGGLKNRRYGGFAFCCINRRHLDTGQRGMVAAKIASLPAHRPAGSASIEAVSQPAAAALLNVSRSAVQRAAIVRDEGTPELVEAVEQGRIAASISPRRAHIALDLLHWPRWVDYDSAVPASPVRSANQRLHGPFPSRVTGCHSPSLEGQAHRLCSFT